MSSRRKFLGQLSAVSAYALQPVRLLGAVSEAAGSPDVWQGTPTRAWAPKVAPLMTEWAAKVDPRAPLPEYPRPQMARTEWRSLNGIWELRKGGQAADAVPSGKTLEDLILVPFPVESALSGVMEYHSRLWYRRTLTIPSAWKGKQVLLHFGAVDYESEVFVNGKQVGLHRGGYDPFSYDITAFLSGAGEQELIVRVFDPTEDGGQPRGKQVTKPRGIMYTPTTGIWQTVWMEPVEATSIEAIKIVPDIDRGVLALTVTVPHATAAHTVAVRVKEGGKVIRTLSGAVNAKLEIPMPKARLWSPESPFLYDLEVELKQNSKKVDTISSYFGMRKLHLGEVAGEKKMFLNNQPIFQSGPLDQGFWPDGIYTAPTDEAIQSDIQRMKDMGFNFVRKHIKVEPARWYYWTDKLGLLVWQDMPSCNSYEARGFVAPPVDTAAFKHELTRMIMTHWNSPSIVLWIIFNEGQGQAAFDTGKLVSMVRDLDPFRLINEASGGDIKGFGELNDVHNYPEPDVRPSNGKQAMVCGEYGGIGYLLPEHSWTRTGKGYTDVQTSDDLLYLYAEFMDQVREMRDHQNLSAIVYTQLTDVETEVNGLMTYDRILKVKPAAIKSVNTFAFVPPPYRAVVPTSEESAQSWRYTLEQPGETWMKNTFDDSHWAAGKGVFGNEGSNIGTTWSKQEIWLRREFRPEGITAADIGNLVIRFDGQSWPKTESRDAVIDIFINGILAYSQKRMSRGYEYRAIRKDARDSIRPNANNMLAVHCKKISGTPQRVDAGIYLRLPAAKQITILPAFHSTQPDSLRKEISYEAVVS